jgi:hypothetical protein
MFVLPHSAFERWEKPPSASHWTGKIRHRAVQTAALMSVSLRKLLFFGMGWLAAEPPSMQT